MADKKKDDKRRLKGLKDQAMTMTSFLARFLGIHNPALMQEGLTHRDLAKMFPNLKRTSYAHILDNPQTVYCGEVVLVVDIANEVIPYVVPEELRYLEDMGMSSVMDDDEWLEASPETWTTETTLPNINDYNLSSMSTYDLSCLLKIYSHTGQIGNYNKVRRELISRPDSLQATRASKERAKKKTLKFERHYEED